MEKKQFELCLEILKRFHKAGILKEFILIGSWCMYFYKEYFSNVSYIRQAAITTRDIDFLIDDPRKIKKKVNVPDLLKDLGFVTVFKGSQGYLKLDHPDLILEFLVPEKGRGTNKPYPLSQLGMNAVALRFLSFLSANTIKAKVDGFYINLPHPANFALHKIIISKRRVREEKAIKDKNAAIGILNALIKKGEEKIIQKIFTSTPGKWQRRIISNLELFDEKKILNILKPKHAGFGPRSPLFASSGHTPVIRRTSIPPR